MPQAMLCAKWPTSMCPHSLRTVHHFSLVFFLSLCGPMCSTHLGCLWVTSTFTYTLYLSLGKLMSLPWSIGCVLTLSTVIRKVFLRFQRATLVLIISLVTRLLRLVWQTVSCCICLVGGLITLS